MFSPTPIERRINKTLQDMFPGYFYTWDTRTDVKTPFKSEVGDLFWGYESTTDKDGTTHIQIDVPGFNKDNLDISYSDSNITISGKNEKLNREFNKTFTFYDYKLRDLTKTTAKIVDGLLTISFPKIEKLEAKKSNKILID